LSFVDIFRKILAPSSILVLSLAVLAIAWSFSTAYRRLFEARLNFDVFDRRFEIYYAARALIDRVKSHEDVAARTSDLPRLGAKIEQARFLFDRPIQDFLREISILSSCILAARDRRGRLQQTSDEEQWLLLGQELSGYDARLTELSEQLAPAFEQAIALPRLTGETSGVWRLWSIGYLALIFLFHVAAGAIFPLTTPMWRP
jgi:hypothetical protein